MALKDKMINFAKVTCNDELMEMAAIQKFPIAIQDFESLKLNGYLYVDKTELIYRLISSGRYYFLSRPRRFGKSMLISTLKAFYEGKKELFEGLAIASKSDITWEKHPVLHLDFNTQQYNAPEKLAYVINDFLARNEQFYGLESESANDNNIDKALVG